MSGRRKILLFADWYEPGYKAGGPIQSCVNFVRYMQDNYQVYVFTSDRDLGAEAPYDNIPSDQWQAAGESVQLYYCSPGMLNWANIRKQLEMIRPDFVYLNSMYSTKFTIYPLLINRLNRRKTRIVLSPRGMLRESAVQFKSFKKKIFLNGFRWLSFHKSIHFHASDDTEVKNVHQYFGESIRVALIPNFPAGLPDQWKIPAKTAGELSMIFIGRVHPIKQLDLLLTILKDLKPVIRLTVIGSLEDKPYWEKCREIIASLPNNITVHYAGEIPNRQIPAISAEHHIFVLPTKGENFGHAIFEALAIGKPVLISDQTPWRNLQAARAGWDLPLEHPELFGHAISQAAAFDQEEYGQWSNAARQYVQRYVNQLNLKEEYLKLFS